MNDRPERPLKGKHVKPPEPPQVRFPEEPGPSKIPVKLREQFQGRLDSEVKTLNEKVSEAQEAVDTHIPNEDMVKRIVILCLQCEPVSQKSPQYLLERFAETFRAEHPKLIMPKHLRGELDRYIANWLEKKYREYDPRR